MPEQLPTNPNLGKQDSNTDDVAKSRIRLRILEQIKGPENPLQEVIDGLHAVREAINPDETQQSE